MGGGLLPLSEYYYMLEELAVANGSAKQSYIPSKGASIR